MMPPPDRSGKRQEQQHHGRRAGETRRAVERLQQHDGVCAIEEAGDEIAELELAERQRRDDDEPRQDRVTQRREHDLHEALQAGAAERIGRVLERTQPERCMSATTVCRK
jgi:hypothetical protein